MQNCNEVVLKKYNPVKPFIIFKRSFSIVFKSLAHTYHGNRNNTEGNYSQTITQWGDMTIIIISEARWAISSTEHPPKNLRKRKKEEEKLCWEVELNVIFNKTSRATSSYIIVFV